MRYLDELARELGSVGIRGRQRARILSETADHLAHGDVARFGEPRAIAQRFADELATAQSRRATRRAFGALGLAGAGFAAAWLLVPAAGGWPDLFSAEVAVIGAAAAFGLLVCPQVSFAAGVLALLQERRLRGSQAAPAAEVSLLLRRTSVALAFGIGAMVSVALYALEFRHELAGWYALGAVLGSVALTIPLVVLVAAVHRTAALRTRVPGKPGNVFDDLPLELPRRPWALCLVLATVVGLLALAAGGGDEGARNAAAEVLLVLACFVALGRPLGLLPAREATGFDPDDRR